MKPPIKVTVTTDNMNRCELRLAGEDGVAHAIQVPSAGNVYMGLHSIREPLQELINGILEAHGIVPDVVEPDPITQPGPPASAEHPVVTTNELPPPAPEPHTEKVVDPETGDVSTIVDNVEVRRHTADGATIFDTAVAVGVHELGKPALAVVPDAPKSDEEPPAAS